MFFRGWNKILSDVHSCLFLTINSKDEEMIVWHAAWTEVLQRSVTTMVAKGRKFSMGTLSGELWKYSKFETYQEFMGINWKFVPYTNININILFDHRLTCMQTNTNFKNNFGGESVMLFSRFINE